MFIIIIPGSALKVILKLYFVELKIYDNKCQGCEIIKWFKDWVSQY
jgi:hypothetical protein